MISYIYSVSLLPVSSLKIVHDRSRCIGCNSCVCIAPQTWVMDEKEGKVLLNDSVQKGNLYVADIFEEDEKANRDAADVCPMRIIKIEKHA